jgi:transcriptional regulator NrdR family protein
MNILPCPFCGHNRHRIDNVPVSEGKSLVRIACPCCDAFKLVQSTGVEKTDLTNVVVEWNKRWTDASQTLDIQLKRLQITEKKLDLQSKKQALKSIERNEILSALKEVRGILGEKNFHTEENRSGTELELHIDPIWSDMDSERLKDKIRLLLDKL